MQITAENKKRKQLVMDISEKDHLEIKKRALNKGITLRVWVMQAIEQMIKIEDQ